MRRTLSLTSSALLGLFALRASAQPTPAPQPATAPQPAAEPQPAPAQEADPTQPVPAPPPFVPAPDATPEPQAPVDVSVAGTRLKETSGSAHVVRPKQLERFKYDDPHQVLLGVPGVYVRGEDGFGLRPNIGMRGALSDRSKKITLMEDGVLFGPAPYSAPAAYYFPLIGRMNAVRVVKGPSTIVNGPHTVAGAIDLQTAPIPPERKTMVDVSFGQYLSRKIHLRQSVADDTRGVLVEAIHVGTAGFKELDGGGDTGFSRYELMAKGHWSFGSIDTLFHDVELKLGYSGEVSNETYVGLTDEDFRLTPYRRYGVSRDDRMEWNRTQVALTHRVTNGGSLTVETTAYRHDFRRIWDRVKGLRGVNLADVLAHPDVPRNQLFYGILSGTSSSSSIDDGILSGPNDRLFVSQGVQTTFKWKPVTGPIAHRIEIGARLHNDSVRRIHEQDVFLESDGALVPTTFPTARTDDNDASTLALAIHAIDAATWGPVTLTGGVRVESIRGTYTDRITPIQVSLTQEVVLPGGGVYVALPKDLGVFFGVYQGFSPVPPSATDQPRPEKSVNYEGGVRFSPRRLRFEVIGFYNDYSNLTNICTESSGCEQINNDQQFNGGSARVYGVEAYAESEWRLRRDLTLPGRIAYTFTDARFESTFSSADPIFGSVSKGDLIPYIPAHQLSASIGVEMPRWAVNVAGTFVDAAREVAGPSDPEAVEAQSEEAGYLPPTDAYFLLDASVSVKPLKFLTLYLNGRNLTNQAYIVARRPFGARPGAPITILGGAKVEF